MFRRLAAVGGQLFHPARAKKRTSGGITLLETILAAFMFCSISIALLSLWYAHYRLQAQSQHRLVANYLCKQLMEEQVNQPLSMIASVPRGSKPAITVDSIINERVRTVSYEYAVTCIDTTYTKDLTVQVFWKEGEIEHEFHLETLLFTFY
jgi:Tfp pilus assembly protein PilV